VTSEQLRHSPQSPITPSYLMSVTHCPKSASSSHPQSPRSPSAGRNPWFVGDRERGLAPVTPGALTRSRCVRVREPAETRAFRFSSVTLSGKEHSWHLASVSTGAAILEGWSPHPCGPRFPTPSSSVAFLWGQKHPPSASALGTQ
jgi:hypothetical protein